MELKDWIKKWETPYWQDRDPSTHVNHITPDHYGQINLLWVMVGRPPINQAFFDDNLPKWGLSGRICTTLVGGVYIRNYATIYNEKEFYTFVKQHPEVGCDSN